MAGREASLTKLTDKRLKIVRFVLGPALIVTGLFLWNDLLGEDMSKMLSGAFQTPEQPQLDFAFMLKGIGPLAMILVGFKLATLKSPEATDE